MHDDIPTPEELHRSAIGRRRASNQTDPASEPYVHAETLIHRSALSGPSLSL